MFKLLKKLSPAEIKKIEQDAKKRGRISALEEAELYCENADGIVEVAGEEYYCFKKETLVDRVAIVRMACFIPEGL